MVYSFREGMFGTISCLAIFSLLLLAPLCKADMNMFFSDVSDVNSTESTLMITTETDYDTTTDVENTSSEPVTSTQYYETTTESNDNDNLTSTSDPIITSTDSDENTTTSYSEVTSTAPTTDEDFNSTTIFPFDITTENDGNDNNTATYETETTTTADVEKPTSSTPPPASTASTTKDLDQPPKSSGLTVPEKAGLISSMCILAVLIIVGVVLVLFRRHKLRSQQMTMGDPIDDAMSTRGGVFEM